MVVQGQVVVSPDGSMGAAVRRTAHGRCAQNGFGNIAGFRWVGSGRRAGTSCEVDEGEASPRDRHLQLRGMERKNGGFAQGWGM